jgi:hypothetical protein
VGCFTTADYTLRPAALCLSKTTQNSTSKKVQIESAPRRQQTSFASSVSQFSQPRCLSGPRISAHGRTVRMPSEGSSLLALDESSDDDNAVESLRDMVNAAIARKSSQASKGNKDEDKDEGKGKGEDDEDEHIRTIKTHRVTCEMLDFATYVPNRQNAHSNRGSQGYVIISGACNPIVTNDSSIHE